ncbi:hypothetical protein GLOIN_2v1789989 [Rhizophagus clarus]|uniref:Uncharacterized protein n=1 Tax=Rhizophagus clarus TaxID=94130 RepID=A0A8H3QG58_9GLOM|nr:hypothetical protein GLOIN_2v1789989 [Rhizophagus clarus]
MANNQVIQVLNPHEPVAEWPDDIALILIKQRRRHHQLLLSRDLDADGYELRSPNWHDRKFYDELSDEFWLRSTLIEDIEEIGIVDGVIDEVDLDLVIIDEIVPILFQGIVVDDHILDLDLIQEIIK